jgi:hypothetical protein
MFPGIWVLKFVTWYNYITTAIKTTIVIHKSISQLSFKRKSTTKHIYNNNKIQHMFIL